ncbi:hypothetical protein [Mesonia mobilis]|uniref:hypothetical protein n=2 Tax=Mesonia mobilis TaxID=369791 RepID=UPI0026EDC30F|nr:hypothetical protein [Mesonia mobilis]|tara:strand:+ start:217 stop:639 length:423 start_codon:yes stop_codon:yes gene_type:complete
MKKYIFYLAFFLISTLSFGQETEDEKIESLKTAFITEALSLTPEEAQAFWPIYNLFEDKKEALYDAKWCEVKNGLDTIEEIDEAKAEQLLATYMKMKEERLKLRQEFVAELEKLMSPKKILMLKKAEHDFHKMLLEKYKK